MNGKCINICLSAVLMIAVILSPSQSMYAQTNIDSIITAGMQKYKLPGLSAAVIYDGEVIWENCYGYADIDRDKNVTDSTLFMLGSISKTFVGVALMQQWEKSKFRLDDDINDYLDFSVRNPNYPDIPITFRMLLTHTSSITGDSKMNDLTLPDFTWGYDHSMTIENFLKGFFIPGGYYYKSNNFNSFKPGKKFDYSSIATTLIAYLVERLSGSAFEQYCITNIFEPLGMDETSWFLSNINQNRLAVPYYHHNGNYYGYPHRGTPLYPCGWLKTDVTQLGRYLITLMQKGIFNGERILDSSTIDSMTTVQFPAMPTQFANHRWGLMIYELKKNSRTLWGHEGGSLGVSTLMYFCRAENTGVILLSNGETLSLPEIADDLFDFAQQLTEVDNEEVPEKSFKLNQNYPNPFNPKTNISFVISKAGYVTLRIYDGLGRIVRNLISEFRSAGEYNIEFIADDLPSGLYLCSLSGENTHQVNKMLLLK